MIKAIIFDMGGVYMSGSFVDFVNRSYQILGIDTIFTTQDEVVFDENLNKGMVTHEECFRNFFKVPISEGQMRDIKDIWMTTWIPSQDILDLVRNLKNNYTLAVLSNSDLLNSINYTEKGWYSHFDHLILSHEVGIIKPDQRIYDIALERVWLPTHECLFIDDQSKVLIPAQNMGMDTIHFRSPEQLKEEFSARNILF